jgi:pSer/pThr/pTyr-binding forkhead associated (FHA) protein
MDNDSMTGTFVNGVEILLPEKCPLSVGDTITLGATTLIYLSPKAVEEEFSSRRKS